MKVGQLICPLIAAAVLCGCAQTSKDFFVKRVDLRESKRKRQADLAIPEFVGKYRVLESRNNSRGVGVAEIVLIAGVPTLQLSRSDNNAVLIELQANECSGDLVNDSSESMFLACFGNAIYSGMSPYFYISNVTSRQVVKSGAIIPLFDPITVDQGYVIQYALGERYESRTVLAVVKEGVGK